MTVLRLKTIHNSRSTFNFNKGSTQLRKYKMTMPLDLYLDLYLDLKNLKL